MARDLFIDDREKLCEMAPVAAAPIRFHIFVCTGKSCSAVDSAAVKEAFERELKARGILFGKEAKGKNPKGTVVLTECASVGLDRKSTRLNSSHTVISYAVFCLKK